MAEWAIFTGSGTRREKAWETMIPDPPPWRGTAGQPRRPFVLPDGLVDAINAALHLRRPLLLTGNPGSGKSTVIEEIAAELDLGPVLRWRITSKSVRDDGLYQYDALGRLHETQNARAQAVNKGESAKVEADVAEYVPLGPWGRLSLIVNDRELFSSTRSTRVISTFRATSSMF